MSKSFWRKAFGAAPAWIFALAVVPPAGAQVVIDHSGGFASNGNLTRNQDAAYVASGGLTVARLTPAVNNMRGSIFNTAQVNCQVFQSTFTFQFTPAALNTADGICFVIQRVGPTALGSGGGNLGYQGIASSVAVKFDIYQNNSFTGIYTNGAAPLTPETVINPPIDFHNGNIFRADLNYDGTTLQVVITDTVTSGSVTQNYPINIPGTVGGNTAHVGFTGATGGLNANQDVRTWTYTVAPAAPTGLQAVGSLQQITVTWNSVTGAQSYTLERSTDPNFGTVTTFPGLTGTSYTDTTVTPYVTYYYRVRAVYQTLSSPPSNTASAMATGPPRTNDHEEGFLDGGDCGCGSIGGPPRWLVALAGALLALTPLRRRKFKVERSA